MSEFVVDYGSYSVSGDVSEGDDYSAMTLFRVRPNLELVDQFLWRGDITRCRRAPQWAKDAMRAARGGR